MCIRNCIARHISLIISVVSWENVFRIPLISYIRNTFLLEAGRRWKQFKLRTLASWRTFSTFQQMRNILKFLKKEEDWFNITWIAQHRWWSNNGIFHNTLMDDFAGMAFLCESELYHISRHISSLGTLHIGKIIFYRTLSITNYSINWQLKFKCILKFISDVTEQIYLMVLGDVFAWQRSTLNCAREALHHNICKKLN